MTSEERLEWLKQIEKDIYVCSIESTLADDMKSCAIHSAIEELEQEPCEDAISRQALLDKKYTVEVEDMWHMTQEVEVVSVSDIKALPSVTPKPKTGHWVRITNGAMKEKYMCSRCGRQIEDDGIEGLLPIKYPYCHCGAEMRGTNDE